MTAVRIEGLPQLLAKLQRVGSVRLVRAAIAEVAANVKKAIATSPPVRRGPAIWRNDTERLAFFAALRAGEIEVPYRRGSSPGSEKLGSKWTVEFRDGGMSAIVGNNVTYGPLVQDKDSQHPYHALTGWPTIQGVAEEETAKADKTMKKYFDAALRQP